MCKAPDFLEAPNYFQTPFEANGFSFVTKLRSSVFWVNAVSS
jgi:hypothetical protein